MPVSLREIIRDDSAVGSGGFVGAVFLTYTLNLNFYEHIIAPALDQAGCSNILIIADPDGYADALNMGAQTISGAGLRYICTPLGRDRQGIQHAKVLLMAGSKCGRLLIGSNNLTLHGFSRNLELVSHFEFSDNRRGTADHYAFIQVWKLINRLRAEGRLPQSANDQIETIREKATWLDETVAEPVDFRIWTSYDLPIWQQLKEWRKEFGLSERRSRLLEIISPYYDREYHALNTLGDALKPAKVNLYIGPTSTNLDGTLLQKKWQGQPKRLTLFGVEAKPKKRNRPLHAKAIIGVEANGAWCVSGSANLTSAALTKVWSTSGNLELVTFHWLPNRDAFKYLVEDNSIRIWELELGNITGVDEEPSEHSTHEQYRFVLSEVSLRGNTLSGKVSSLLDATSSPGELRFLKSGAHVPVAVDKAGTFTASLSASLDTAEAVQLQIGQDVTPYRWIDQPDELARYGARNYHRSIKEKVQTFDGAGELFEELLNFLWGRIDPQHISEESTQVRLIRKRHYSRTSGLKRQVEPLPPSPSNFVTEREMTEFVEWEIGQQQPYDRNYLNMRDLFSLALLKLATPTQPDFPVDDQQPSEGEPVKSGDGEEEVERVGILTRLGDYLYRYCKRYGARLSDPEFVKKLGPNLLFQNHFTLGRVLLEFAAKSEVFTSEDLSDCFWFVWAPLVLPSLVGFEGTPTLTTFKSACTSVILDEAWQESGMSSLSMAMMVEALGMPPQWQHGLYDLPKAKRFMIARKFIDRLKEEMGEQAFILLTPQIEEAEGLRLLNKEESEQVEFVAREKERLEKVFHALANYTSPTEQRLSPILRLDKLRTSGQSDSAQVAELEAKARSHGAEDELREYQSMRRRIKMIEGEAENYYCPGCHIQLTLAAVNKLLQGKLVLCPISRDAFIYWRPKVPTQVIQQ